jgi:hypothetical protein
MHYNKIARRFNNETLSRPYVDSLKEVKVIPFLSQDGKQAPDDPGARVEFGSDRLFLQGLLSFHQKHPTMLGTEIEDLLNKVVFTEEGVIELYTNDTRVEFHKVLIVLLDRFKHALDILAPSKKHTLGPLAPPRPIERWLFNDTVKKLHFYGYSILRLARGRAFQMHLENIETLLDHPGRTTAAGASTDEHDQEHDNTRDEEQGEDFDGVLPPQKLKSYVAWLRLIVGHFDEVEILSGFVHWKHFSYDSISIQIMLPPHTTPEKLEWRKLFTDPHYLPTNNRLMLTFLEQGVLAAQKDAELKDADIAALKKKLDPHPNIIGFLRALGKSSGFPGTLHCEACLASLLLAFTESLSTPDDIKYKEIEILPQLKVKYLSCHLFLTSDPHFLFL